MKYWEYSAEDLKNKKMYALLPLQVFKCRKKIRSIYNSSIDYVEKANLINNEFRKLISTIENTINILGDLYYSQEIVGVDLEKILRVLTNISEYLYNRYGEYSNIGKEVENMVTTLYNPVLKEEGFKEGFKEGVVKAKKEMVWNMLKEGLEIKLIVKFSGLAEEEVSKIKKEFDGQAQ